MTKSENGKAWPKMNKNAKFGRFWAENPSFYWSKGTHITEKPPRHLVWIGFWSGIESNGPNMIVQMIKNTYFGPNLAVFGPKIYFLEGWRKTFGILISGNQ